MRIFAGFLIAAVALGCALWLHHWNSEFVIVSTTSPTGISSRPGSEYDAITNPGETVTARRKVAPWQDSVALALAVAGIGAGIAVGRRKPPPISV